MKQGVAVGDVYQTLQAYLGGLYLNQFNRFGRQWGVFLQAEGAERRSEEDINQYYVRNNDGNMVSLSSLVTTRRISGPEYTNRFNLYRAAQVLGAAAAQTIPDIERLIEQTENRINLLLGKDPGLSGPAGAWTFAPQVTLPIFNAGRVKSGVRFTEAQQRLALTQYQQAIKTAFREVSDTLVEYRKVKEIRAQHFPVGKTGTGQCGTGRCGPTSITATTIKAEVHEGQINGIPNQRPLRHNIHNPLASSQPEFLAFHHSEELFISSVMTP